MATNNLFNVPWSIPPIISNPNLPDTSPDALPHPGNQDPALKTMRIPLRKGIICQVNMDRAWLLQNVSVNEDDHVEFSIHGEPNGTWNKFGPGTSVKAATSMFFLKRTDKEVLYLALFPQ